ncbi:Lrp/AsnC family transcriptional regulator [Streptomyces sp. NPDC058086]|uniref:Lrp/AsnC family transcriptional regulator n=1 Tax=Streptomyces sp. NPDC058086 TaxID=3346334 RepID=UPI0036DFDD85
MKAPMLQEDGRRTNRDMVQELGVAPSTCLERIRSLRRSGILTGLHAEADLAAVGRGLQAVIAVRDTDHLHAVVPDKLTKCPELAVVRTSVVYGHMRKKVIGPTLHRGADQTGRPSLRTWCSSAVSLPRLATCRCGSPRSPRPLQAGEVRIVDCAHDQGDVA